MVDHTLCFGFISDSPCPADMIYTSDGSGCPETCSGQDNPITCNITGIASCVCPDGKLLDGKKCVYPTECGCTTPEGTYISVSMLPWGIDTSW